MNQISNAVISCTILSLRYNKIIKRMGVESLYSDSMVLIFTFSPVGKCLDKYGALNLSW